ncbi:MAG: hypothetical protein IT340_04440 [Chloroflexi bacterium]|nr:hypothetical protein [Chloroflexota bacterium]
MTIQCRAGCLSRWMLLLVAIVLLGAPAPVGAAEQKKATAVPASASACADRPGQLLWTQGVAPAPMALAAFPRPRNDIGRGIHWAPTTYQEPDDVDRLLKEARAMRINWITFLNDGTAIGPNDYLVQQIVKADIEPVLRVYTPNGQPVPGAPESLAAMVQHYRGLGVRYFQLFNEPNNNRENPDGRPNVARYVTDWSDAARVVIMNGGLPGIGALSPGGDMDDLQFLDGTLDHLAQRGQTHLLDCAWLALHNYSFNRPIEYVGDQHSYLGFRLYHDIIQRRLGRPLPMIGTEGGTHVGADFDPAYPIVDATRQAELVLDAYRYLERPGREPYYFAFTYWIIADEEPADGWDVPSPPPLFQAEGVSALVARLKPPKPSPNARTVRNAPPTGRAPRPATIDPGAPAWPYWSAPVPAGSRSTSWRAVAW